MLPRAADHLLVLLQGAMATGTESTIAETPSSQPPHTLDPHCNWLHTRSPQHPQASPSLTDSITDPLTACTPSLTAVSVWRTCPSQCTLRLSSVRFSRSSSLLTAPLLGGKPGRRRPGES